MKTYHKTPNPETKRKIFALYDNRCVHCQQQFSIEKLTCDHIIPRGHGGAWGWKNMVPACFECNNCRGDKLLSEERVEQLKKLALKNFNAFYYDPEHLELAQKIRRRKRERREKRRQREMEGK